MIGLEKSRGGKTNLQVSLTYKEKPKNAKLQFNAFLFDDKCSFSFRYNQWLIAQLVGRHEDLFNPENSCWPRDFLGWTNFHVFL